MLRGRPDQDRKVPTNRMVRLWSSKDKARNLLGSNEVENIDGYDNHQGVFRNEEHDYLGQRKRIQDSYLH